MSAGLMYDVDEAGRQLHLQQFQQQQHYTDQATATTLPPSYHQTRMTPGDYSYIAAAASQPVPSFDVPMTTHRVPRAVQVAGPFTGVQPQMSSVVNAPAAAQQLAQPQPLVHVNSLLPGQVNVPHSAAAVTTPGTFLYILCVIYICHINTTSYLICALLSHGISGHYCEKLSPIPISILHAKIIADTCASTQKVSPILLVAIPIQWY